MKKENMKLNWLKLLCLICIPYSPNSGIAKNLRNLIVEGVEAEISRATYQYTFYLIFHLRLVHNQISL
jgi:hypothetical protein